jgi:hypothetical protein
MIVFAVLNFALSIACSFVQVHLFWLLDQCLDSMHWERYHQTDCPTSIFSTLLSSDTGKRKQNQLSRKNAKYLHHLS